MDNIDLELYRVFYEVVKYNNISKAAEAMFISQSAITQSIQKLENMLGGKVFYRNKRGVELTEEGRNLYDYIKDSIEKMSNAENIFSNYVNLDKGRIRIGGGNSIIASLIMEPLIEFIKKYPNIEVSIIGGVTDKLMQSLSNGELDLVALNLPYKTKKYSNVEVTPLKNLNYVFYASKKYLKKHPVNNIKDLENQVLIMPKYPAAKRKILDDYCKKIDLELVPTYEITSSSVMKGMVLGDIGIGFANEQKIKDILNKVDIIEKIDADETKEGIATLNKSMMNRATVELVKMIKEHYKENKE
jgi:DNA-binding transcriptional LysR family regulator